MALRADIARKLASDDLAAYGGGSLADLRMIHYYLWCESREGAGMIRCVDIVAHGERKVSILYLAAALDAIDPLPVDTVEHIAEKALEWYLAWPFGYGNVTAIAAWIAASARPLGRWLDWRELDLAQFGGAIQRGCTLPLEFKDYLVALLSSQPISYHIPDDAPAVAAEPETPNIYGAPRPVPKSIAGEIAKELFYGSVVTLDKATLDYEIMIPEHSDSTTGWFIVKDGVDSEGETVLTYDLEQKREIAEAFVATFKEDNRDCRELTHALSLPLWPMAFERVIERREIKAWVPFAIDYLGGKVSGIIKQISSDSI